MSRTTRKDSLDIRGKRPDQVFMGEAIPAAPSPKEVARAHRDGKKSYKPGRKAKVYLAKGSKAKTRRQLDAVANDPESTPLPCDPKHHVWDYN